MVGQMYAEYLDSARAALPLSGGDDPRQLADRHQFHRHAGRPRGLGAVFPAPRLRRMWWIKSRAAARRTFHVPRYNWRGRPSPHRTPLHRAEALPPLAAGQAAHPVARLRQGGRSIFRRVLRDAVSLAHRQRDIATDQSQRGRGAAGPDRPGHRAHALPVGRLRLADRRRAAEIGEGAHLDRAKWAAGL